jgi:hypothetical protein
VLEDAIGVQGLDPDIGWHVLNGGCCPTVGIQCYFGVGV